MDKITNQKLPHKHQEIPPEIQIIRNPQEDLLIEVIGTGGTIACDSRRPRPLIPTLDSIEILETAENIKVSFRSKAELAGTKKLATASF